MLQTRDHINFLSCLRRWRAICWPRSDDAAAHKNSLYDPDEVRSAGRTTHGSHQSTDVIIELSRDVIPLFCFRHLFSLGRNPAFVLQLSSLGDDCIFVICCSKFIVSNDLALLNPPWACGTAEPAARAPMPISARPLAAISAHRKMSRKTAEGIDHDPSCSGLSTHGISTNVGGSDVPAKSCSKSLAVCKLESLYRACACSMTISGCAGVDPVELAGVSTDPTVALERQSWHSKLRIRRSNWRRKQRHHLCFCFVKHCGWL